MKIKEYLIQQNYNFEEENDTLFIGKTRPMFKNGMLVKGCFDEYIIPKEVELNRPIVIDTLVHFIDRDYLDKVSITSTKYIRLSTTNVIKKLTLTENFYTNGGSIIFGTNDKHGFSEVDFNGKSHVLQYEKVEWLNQSPTQMYSMVLVGVDEFKTNHHVKTEYLISKPSNIDNISDVECDTIQVSLPHPKDISLDELIKTNQPLVVPTRGDRKLDEIPSPIDASKVEHTFWIKDQIGVYDIISFNKNGFYIDSEFKFVTLYELKELYDRFSQDELDEIYCYWKRYYKIQ
jgi:hypothetical protein